MCQALEQRSFRAIIKLNVIIYFIKKIFLVKIMVVIVKTLLKKVLKPFTTITIVFLALYNKYFTYYILI